MAFQPQVNQELAIGDAVYRIAEHPHARGIPYGQEGRAATVYQLVRAGDGGDKRALKVFKPRFQVPWLVSLADQLAHYATIPGLRVCSRTVLTATRHKELVRQHPDLNYAVLMPWIEGPTWMEVVLEGQAWSVEQSLAFAGALASILAEMEERRLAHCDLSGPNLLLPGLVAAQAVPAQAATPPVELVDVEQLYGPGLSRPEYVPSGSAGYAHKTAPAGLWSSTADRFAGAVLLCEMLGWCDPRVRQAAWSESYFAPDEMQQPGSERYNLLLTVLRERWGEEVAWLLERVWESDTLADCPAFGRWLVALPDKASPEVDAPTIVPAPQPVTEPVPKVVTAQDAPIATPTPSADAALAPAMVLLERARELEGQGRLYEAWQHYQEALSAAPPASGLHSQLQSRVAELQAQLSRPSVGTAHVQAQAPPTATVPAATPPPPYHAPTPTYYQATAPISPQAAQPARSNRGPIWVIALSLPVLIVVVLIACALLLANYGQSLSTVQGQSTAQPTVTARAAEARPTRTTVAVAKAATATPEAAPTTKATPTTQADTAKVIEYPTTDLMDALATAEAMSTDSWAAIETALALTDATPVVEDPASTEPERIPIEEFKALYDDPDKRPVIVDVRYRESYEAGHIWGAISVPEAEVDKRLAELPKDRLIVAYCN